MSKLQNVKLVLGTASLVYPLTGIGQYTLNLAQMLLEKSELNIGFFNGYAWADKVEVRHIPQVGLMRKLVHKLIPRPHEARRVIQQRLFDSICRENQPDLYHEPSFLPLNFDRKTIITVHDLSCVRFPEAHPAARVRVMDKLLPVAIEKASCIIADSEFTKQEILSLFGVPEEKVYVTHLGKSKDFYPRSGVDLQQVLKKYRLQFGHYMLAVGTLEPRKNLIQAIQAYRLLPEPIAQQFPLVIAGMRGWKEKDLLKELEVLLRQNKALLLGYVPTEDLPFLYSGARGFVFPSFYEGFGLPVLEAMASGIPVIAANASAVPEVLGEAGLTMDVGDVDSLADKITLLCEDELVHSRLSKAGLEQAKKFSWESCADQTLMAYQYALGRNK